MKSSEPSAADSLDITLHDENQSSILRLKGRLGLDTSPDLRNRLLGMLHEQPSKTVIVDLGELSYIDASGVATLLEALKVARNHKGSLRLTGLQGRLLHLFEVTGVLPLFETDPSVNKASDLKVS